MKHVLTKIEHDRDFELVVQWNYSPLANLKMLENIEFEQVNLSPSGSLKSSSSKGGISIYDCLTWFS